MIGCSSTSTIGNGKDGTPGKQGENTIKMENGKKGENGTKGHDKSSTIGIKI